MKYMDMVKKWAKEFRETRHTLTKEEKEALDSDFYLEYLKESEEWETASLHDFIYLDDPPTT